MEQTKKEFEGTINEVQITGVLVKNGLEVRHEGEENENISGSLILRTEDGSEHEVRYFANKFKKDNNGKFTNEESKLYSSYKTMLEEFKSLELLPQGTEIESLKLCEDVDVIKIGVGAFKDNDFKGKDDKIISTNQIQAKFANRIKEEYIDITPRTATFEVSGVITKMEAETYKEQPTGNGVVMLDVIGYGGKIIPIKLLVPQNLMEGFAQAGFYESGSAKFTGHIINTKKEEEFREKQAFGEDKVSIKTVTVKKYEICGGSPLGTLENLKLTQEQYEAGKSKRRLKLEEVKNSSNDNNSIQQGFTQPQENAQTSQPQATTNNPFNNPFAK